MENFNIDPFKYSFSEEDIDYILNEFGSILKNKEYLTMGKFGADFENYFAEYNQSTYAISVSSGTAAIEIILKTIGVEGGKVIVPTNTFGATIIPVLRAGAIPIFVDCADDLTLCPVDTARKLSEDVKAVITVHIGGLISPNIYKIKEICEDRNIPLIEDAAHAVGASLNGKKAGSFGIAAAFSFFSTKLMTCGEGGMIASNNEDINKKARLLRDHAKSGKNRMIEDGYNWRLTEIQSLLGIRQLKRLDEFIAKRNQIAKIYGSILNNLDGIRILYPPPEAVHNRYKYIVVLEGCSPSYIENDLKNKYNIPLGGYVYEEPCHLQPAFIKFNGQGCHNAEKLCASHICLPIYQEMTKEEATYVANSLCKLIQEY